MKRIIISIILISMVIGWMALIFSMSAEPADVSTVTSGNTIRKIFNLVYPGFKDMDAAEQEEIIEASQHFVRKAAHFSIYVVLGALVGCAAYYIISKNKICFPLSVLIGVLYAVSDEIHQLYVPGRSGEVRDVLIDSSGVLLGCFIVFLIYKRIGSISNKHKTA